ncbi:hypothetical protein H261_00365 [Paramagnetospirillum caucaseum]|uniref:GLPGLI family protein n=1 Tax=Paramagnetospirillum caucaseum TaxID=1244869 RepID=M2YFU1_9PROT|nr:hypothetical protein [Paramagnetospirillum caucaseum]EME71986.1 hypothetical protein H261_00365 [Paramagnetospirillum caucaseum]
MQFRSMAAAAVVAAFSLAPGANGAESHAATTPAKGGAASPIAVSVAVENFALVEKAPVSGGFGIFTIEATALLPAPRKRESFTPTEDEHFYTLRRTVERFLLRKEIPKGWTRSNEATFSFKNELARFPRADGIAYAIEGELVLHGAKPIPVGVTLAAPPGGVVLRYSVGIMAANQTLLTKEGVIDGPNRKAGWMLSLRPSGPDAAIPVRAVFAVRAEGGDEAAQRAALEGVTATLNASSDGRAAVAERANDATEWLKPLQTFIRPDQVTAKGGGKEAKDDKKEKKGGH